MALAAMEATETMESMGMLDTYAQHIVPYISASEPRSFPAFLYALEAVLEVAQETAEHTKTLTLDSMIDAIKRRLNESSEKMTPMEFQISRVLVLMELMRPNPRYLNTPDDLPEIAPDSPASGAPAQPAL